MEKDNKPKNRKIQLLDCTLRDGGLGLEDAQKNGIADIRISEDAIAHAICCLRDSRIDIVELGSIEISEDDKRGFVIYQNVEAVSETIPEKRSQGQMFVGLFRGPDTPDRDVPPWRKGLCDGLRVIIRYSELQKSLDFCAMLAEKGYRVFVQPMLTMRYTEEEIQRIIDASNAMGAYALYFVDSYGYMQSEDILRFLRLYDEKLSENIRIGFHAHNNMNLAYANALTFLSQITQHDVILDACATGMGQGAGNLQTELIVPYLNGQCHADYNFPAVLDLCELVETYNTRGIWGYSTARLLPALYKTAYKYAVALRHKYHLSYSEINELLRRMPDEMRHRYTPEETERLLDICGYGSRAGSPE